MKRLLTTLTTIMAFGMLAVSVPVLAQTPDGETPANEGICDDLVGATPGLYGLCVAFCEAQDLDEFNEEKPSSQRILTNYNKKKKAGDPDMPCVAIDTCPCWSPDDLVDTFPNPTSCDINIVDANGSNATVRFSTNGTDAKCNYRDTVTNTVRNYRVGPEFSLEDFESCQASLTAFCQ